jgi:hypothetical protein
MVVHEIVADIAIAAIELIRIGARGHAEGKEGQSDPEHLFIFDH